MEHGGKDQHQQDDARIAKVLRGIWTAAIWFVLLAGFLGSGLLIDCEWYCIGK